MNGVPPKAVVHTVAEIIFSFRCSLAYKPYNLYTQLLTGEQLRFHALTTMTFTVLAIFQLIASY